MRATEGRRVTAIKRQQALLGSTPLLLTGWRLPGRTSNEVKTGQNSASPPSSRIGRVSLQIFHVVTKRTSDSRNGDKLMSSNNSCRITDLIYHTRVSLEAAELFFFFFRAYCSVFSSRCQVLLEWKRS